MIGKHLSFKVSLLWTMSHLLAVPTLPLVPDSKPALSQRPLHRMHWLKWKLLFFHSFNLRRAQISRFSPFLQNGSNKQFTVFTHSLNKQLLSSPELPEIAVLMLIYECLKTRTQTSPLDTVKIKNHGTREQLKRVTSISVKHAINF